jgi:hypothetical protein
VCAMDQRWGTDRFFPPAPLAARRVRAPGPQAIGVGRRPDEGMPDEARNGIT